jgi:ribonucleases P/MRP protein subunit RPP40
MFFASSIAFLRCLEFDGFNSARMSTLFPSGSASTPKTFVSLGQLPGYVAPSQAPTKQAPWRAIREVSHVNSTTVNLPDELYHIIWDSVDADISKPKYAKVIMKLEEVLEREFFTEYIKQGG